MNWSVPLRGDSIDLDTLVEHFTDDPRVYRHESGEYRLTASRFDAFEDARDAVDEAKRVAAELDGIARLHHANHHSVDVVKTAYYDDGVRRCIYGLVEQAVERDSAGRIRVLMGGKDVTPESELSQDARSAAANPELAQALRLLSNDAATWGDLYKVWELVNRNAGSRVFSDGWATKNEVERLTATADRPELSGEGARHAVTKGSPANARLAMGLEEAAALCRGLVVRWAESIRDDVK